MYLRHNPSVQPNAVLAVVGKIKGVSIVSPPAKKLPPDTVLNSVQVKQEKSLPWLCSDAGRLEKPLIVDRIGTQTRSAKADLRLRSRRSYEGSLGMPLVNRKSRDRSESWRVVEQREDVQEGGGESNR